MGRIQEFLRDAVAGLGDWWAGVRVPVLAFLAFTLGLLELVDPYALSYVLPDRWAGLAPLALGAAIFLLRKAVPAKPEVEEVEPDYETGEDKADGP